ncbi:MAG: hypothetical protein D6782_01395, partial [Alphaproteobacteria bacterium]
MTLWLRTGTVDVTNGSTAVIGTGTNWISQVNVGDFFSIDQSKFYEVAAVNSNTSITISPAYAETTATGQTYAIARVSPKWSLASSTATRVADLLAITEAGVNTIRTVSGTPLPSIGTDGDYAIDPAAGLLYGPKAAGAWPAGVSIAIVNKGAWNASTQYEIGQGVTHLGAFWLAKQQHTNKEPGVAPDWATYWDKAAAAGADGIDAGLKYSFDALTADADPGAGNLRINNAAYASATEIYVSDFDANGADVSGLLAAIDDSANATDKATLLIVDRNDDATFAAFRVNASSVDAAGYFKLQVAHIVSNNTFSASDSLSFQYLRSGDRGTDGVSAGPKFAFSASTTDADPGSGALKLNNSSPASATKLFVDDQDSTGTDISAWLLGLDDSTNPVKGQITLRGFGADGNFAIYDITGLTDKTGYVSLDIQHVRSGGAFAANDVLVLSFARAGDQGLDAGAQYVWDSGTLDADPGTSKLRFNNAVLSSVTELYIDDVDAFGADLSAWVATWDDSTSAVKGQLITREKRTGTALAVFNVSGITAATGYTKVQVAHVASNGSFTNGDSIAVNFVRTGSEGVHQGLKYSFSAATDDADPGSGTLRLNAASSGAATQIFIDDLDGTGADVSAWIAAWDDSTNATRASLILRDINDATTFAIYDITGASVDATGYYKLQVAHRVSNGSFSAGDSLAVVPLISGNKGLDAAATGVEFDFDAGTTDANPGAGKLRLNNVLPASATFAYINDAEANGADMSAWLASFDDTTNTSSLGILTLTELRDATNFAVYRVTSLEDATTYFKVGLTHLGSNGSWAASDRLVAHFAATGDKGLDASGAGVNYSFDTVTADADPGAGKVRLNNSNIGLATEIYINDADVNAADMSAWFNSFDDSGNPSSFGVLTINELRDAANFAVYKVTGITDNTSYFTLTVTHLGSNGSWAANDSLLLNFSAAGVKGDAGADGSEPGLQWNFDGASTTMAKPSVGDLRANNADPTLATALAIDAQTAETGNPDARGLLIAPA